ncbi:MAG TPA: hypothetical protein VMJ10_24925 [Kofleriaceae bacterium]|nr:hypothetical protein [Kofleriaceae bacterium]
MTRDWLHPMRHHSRAIARSRCAEVTDRYGARRALQDGIMCDATDADERCGRDSEAIADRVSWATVECRYFPCGGTREDVA